MSRRHTLAELQEMADALGAAARVEEDHDEAIAVLVVNGRESGDYASLCAFDGGAA